MVLTAGATWQGEGRVAPGVSKADMRRDWLELQQEQARLSRHAQHRIAEDATHLSIALEHGHTFVEAVHEMVAAVMAARG
ncbi:MAG: hypothetical protein KIT87_02990 [Anaerolineae bacterium]|nr:hypothetical protein [Anaerolineae bacterium]